MDFKTFEKEMVARKSWKGIRVVGYGEKIGDCEESRRILAVAEFTTGHQDGYYDLYIAVGKKLAAFARNEFEKSFKSAAKVDFENISFDDRDCD